MSSSSSSSSDEGLPDSESNAPSKKKIQRFTNTQKAFLNAYYNKGMKGTGKEYKNLIKKASTDAGLTPMQVKVYCVLSFYLYYNNNIICSTNIKPSIGLKRKILKETMPHQKILFFLL